MKPSSLDRTIAALRAVAWLNSFRDALDSGVLCVHPGLSEERIGEIDREMTTFLEIQLPRIHRDLQMPSEAYATVHLKKWEGDSIPYTVQGAYPFTELLKEQKRFRAGRDALHRAKKLAYSGNLEDSDYDFMLRNALTLAESYLLPATPPMDSFEPGVVGERLRDCDETLEVALNALHWLRKDDYPQEAADSLVETCREMLVRACKLADHLRNEGLV